jgi:hypothetical protein
MDEVFQLFVILADRLFGLYFRTYHEYFLNVQRYLLVLKFIKKILLFFLFFFFHTHKNMNHVKCHLDAKIKIKHNKISCISIVLINFFS